MTERGSGCGCFMTFVIGCLILTAIMFFLVVSGLDYELYKFFLQNVH